MYQEKIAFHSEGLSYVVEHPVEIKQWLHQVILNEGSTLDDLNYIFCSDEYLHAMNVEHLNHDTYTDVITFQYMDDVVAGDIFISVERTNENAATYGVSADHELHRVMVHGLLHLLGYKDKNPEDKTLMTQKEDEYLNLLSQSRLA